MNIAGVIPVRYNSKRFPGKAMVELWGKPLLQYVYEQTAKSGIFDTIIIATDDVRIEDLCKRFNAQVVMTQKDCPSGSDRVAEVISRLDCKIAVNIQADQPILPAQILEEVVRPLHVQSDILMSTLIYPLNNLESLYNPNVVKVIVDKHGFAIYFSRSPIPYIRNKLQDVQLYFKHIGIYAYRKEFILKYAQLPPSPIEMAEGLEQLRVLEYGYRIKTVVASKDSVSVDTKEDLELLEKKHILSRES